MMKKISLILVGILLLSSFTTLSMSQEADNQTITIQNNFTEPQIKFSSIEKQEYVEIISSDSCAVLHHSGKPLLPRNIRTIELPFNTEITDVDLEVNNIETIAIPHKILPAPQPVIRGINSKEIYNMNEEIYQSNELYPDNWMRLSTGVGLNKENKHTTFLTIELFPYRYNPVEDVIQYAEDIEISIHYHHSQQNPFPVTSEYEMVIIAPNTFSNSLQRLIDHKNNVGVSTYLKTTEEIYDEYTGVDKPEQIKYFIKDALETNGIKYVMLVGGMKSPFFGRARDDANQGTRDWYVPVRYTNLVDGGGGIYDPGFISDLYYADIYETGGNFSSWDTNGDGIFAKWSRFIGQKDELDLYPDLYVGRLACRNTIEVGFMVKKIIEYETKTAGSDWFNNMIGIGGDSHDDRGTNYLEGEVVCDHIFDRYMESFTPVKLYSSYKESKPDQIPSDVNIIREVTDGAGFLLFDGHGSPGSWNTHWPGVFNWGDTPGGISTYDFSEFENTGKYPICVVGGCHNSQFNITLLSTALNQPFTWSHGVPYAECFGWHMARKKDGGSN